MVKQKPEQKTQRKKYVIDETGSLWNQLRTAWWDYQELKSNPDNSRSLKELEIRINRLLDDLKIKDEKRPSKLFTLTTEKFPEKDPDYGN